MSSWVGLHCHENVMTKGGYDGKRESRDYRLSRRRRALMP